MSLKWNLIAVSLIVALFGCGQADAQSDNPKKSVIGRWDITVNTPDGAYPSWLEIEKSGVSTLVGRYVGRVGSARPVSEFVYSGSDNTFRFSVPPQWVENGDDEQFEFQLEGDQLSGWTSDSQGNKYEWTAVRAPELRRNEEPEWGEPTHLLKGSGLEGWQVIDGESQWQVEEGVLINSKAGGNLITDQKFKDFKLHVEFRYPEGSNSGIYLRGRYEVQVQDDYGKKPESHYIGGVYGFIDPSENAAKKAGEWQTYDITLKGRMVDVTLNGVQVICNREIPGITGGAMDSNEGEPGSLMIQGDHGPVEYRNIVITPAK